MNEIINLKEIAHQMELGLDGLEAFLDTCDSVNFQMRGGGEVASFNPLRRLPSRRNTRKSCITWWTAAAPIWRAGTPFWGSWSRA